MKQTGIDFQVYTDPETRLSELFDVHAIPLTVILDKDRRILFMESGEMDWTSHQFKAQLERWLSG